MAVYNITCFNMTVSPTELSSRIECYCCKILTPNGGKHHEKGIKGRMKTLASKSGGSFLLGSVLKKCETCAGQGAIECSGCKGTGRNKKNGNIFERWKCFNCQGFGMKSCPSCGKEGLTPEQRGER